MKNYTRRVLAIICLLSVTPLSSCVSKDNLQQPVTTPITVHDLLVGHNVSATSDAGTVFRAEAERKVSFTRAESGKHPGSFSRLVTVARNRQLFRYERVDPLAPTKQIELFDGYAVYRTMAADGRLIEDSQRPGNSPSEAVAFEIRAFGLLPVLARLIAQKPDSVYEGVTEEGLHKLKVTVSGRIWTLYADSERLIRRLEFDDNAIAYDEYCWIDGARLPFNQKFFRKLELYFELRFTRIDLKPAFPLDYFSRQSILTDVLRQ